MSITLVTVDELEVLRNLAAIISSEGSEPLINGRSDRLGQDAMSGDLMSPDVMARSHRRAGDKRGETECGEKKL